MEIDDYDGPAGPWPSSIESCRWTSRGLTNQPSLVVTTTGSDAGGPCPRRGSGRTSYEGAPVRMAESPWVIQNDHMVTLGTPRLILRRWREEDIAPMAAVHADPEVMRWIRDGSVRDEQQTRDGVRAWESEWESQGFGLFAVEIRSTGELAGFTGLSVPRFLPEVLPAVEVGWRLGRSHWGQGLATEAAAAAVRFGFEERGLERIVSIAQVGNDASERIMTKLGMHPDRETVNPTCGRRVRVYALSSDQYATTTR